MPTSTENNVGRDQDNDRDGSEQPREKGAKSKSSSSKTKDLSHVPCKFFKVGSCTAGASCPFSHNVAESGASKDVCTWFVKGNCKFGHKCALAHIMPGQGMAMDRKNKKAAQAAAAAAGGGGREGGRGGRGQKRETGGAGGRNSLVTGSTAPTRSSRPPMPMPLKATLSPSAPAPPLKDTEFARFGLPDDDTKLDKAPAQTKQTPSDPSPTTANERPRLSDWTSDEPLEPSKSPSSPNEQNANASRRLGINHLSKPSNDFGPIGSPTRSITSGTSAPRANGLSPGTSPVRINAIPPSPFSAPGTQTTFNTYDNNLSPPSNELKFRSGIAASLGANHGSHPWNLDSSSIPSQGAARAIVNRTRSGGTAHLAETVVEDGDLEDFLPSSLNDLLTPEERSRRLSRSHSGQPPHTQAIQETIRASNQTRFNASADGGASGMHRYSRSVPAPSLLGELRSIWSDNPGGISSGIPGAGGIAASPDRQGMKISSGTPSSYKSGSAFGGRSFTDDNFNPSLLSPSNASAAFLPGFHQHYKSAASSNLRVPSNHTLNPNAPPNPLSSNQFQPSVTLSAASHLTSTFAPRTNSAFHSSNTSHLTAGRPISNNVDFSAQIGMEGKAAAEPMANALSPSARALQAHAPGQSLPQGLAAGYSRIHALPSANLPSPGLSGGFSPGYGTSVSPGVGNDWNSNLDQLPPSAEAKLSGSTGLDSMFSRLSYSAATSRPPAMTAVSSGSNPPSMSRNVSGGRQWGTLSPLSGPVVTGDDDDLFSFDG